MKNKLKSYTCRICLQEDDFIGENPLISGDIKSPVLLKRIGEITDAGKHGGLVFNSIREMLNKDYSKRPHPNKTLDHFLQIYEDITKHKK